MVSIDEFKSSVSDKLLLKGFLNLIVFFDKFSK